MRWWASACSKGGAGTTPLPTPVPNVPQFTRNKQEIKRLKRKEKKKKKKKKRNPPTPHPGLSARHWLQVCGCVCVRACVYENQCVCGQGRKSLWEYVRTGVCARGGSMGVRGTPSISSLGQTPLLRDSRCSSSAEVDRKHENQSFKSKVTIHLEEEKSWDIWGVRLTATSSRLLWWSLTDRPLSCCCSCPTPWLLRSREGMNQSWSSSSSISWKQRSKNSCSNSSSSTWRGKIKKLRF